MTYCENDSKHEIIDVDLRDGGMLHRFLNAGRDPYSAIYVDGEEIWSTDREQEKEMIDAWNSMSHNVRLGK
jgi:hypothetical protein